jgi:DNA-binding NarL/FixJ family response regulator
MNETKEYHNIGKTRILIVDDHPVVRQGVASLINMESDLMVCAEAENAVQAFEALEKETIDLAIVDISLNGTNGIQLTEKIKSKHPDLPVLILTIHDDAAYTKRALEAGAKGYVNKREAAETIIAALRLVLSGKQYFKGQISQDVLKHPVQIDYTGDTLEHKKIGEIC